MVANHVNGKPVNEDLGYLAHLGDLPDNMEDARRVIIATQDLLEKKREKHRKATGHICELVHILEFMAENQDFLMTVTGMQQKQIADLVHRIQAEADYSRKVADHAQQSSRERDAVLTTMRLLNNQPTSVVMGHSNRDQGR